MLLAGIDDEEKPEFEELVKAQIKTLRKQLDKIPKASKNNSPILPASVMPAKTHMYGLRALVNGMSVADEEPSKKAYTSGAINCEDEVAHTADRGSEFQRILDALSRNLGSGTTSTRTFI